MTVTFDAGIYISAIQFKGTPAAALRHAVVVNSLVTCRELESEIISVMEAKFGRNPAQIAQDLWRFLLNAVRITITGSVSGVCRDRRDDYLLECALTSGSQLIVTGDKDLLALDGWQNIRILTPRQYLDRSS